MSGDRCPTCDKVTATQDDCDAPGHEDGCECPRCLSLCWRRWWNDVCIMPGVDWRSRFLAAERDRDEAVVRAERAEAECGAMRRVAERALEQSDCAEACAQDVFDRALNGVMDAGFDVWVRATNRTEDAADEWRRTRQSKERP